MVPRPWPDQRNYGRTTGLERRLRHRPRAVPHGQPGARCGAGKPRWSHRQVRTVVGHDFGASVAGLVRCCGLDVPPARLMSSPFGGTRRHPFDTRAIRQAPPVGDIHRDLAALPGRAFPLPVVLRHARGQCVALPARRACPARAYYHHKSADDWSATDPFRCRPGRPPSWRRCRPTTSWTWAAPWPRDRRNTCPTRPPWRPTAGCRARTARLRRGTSAPASRVACSGTAAAPAAPSTPRPSCGRAARSTCRPPSSRARRDWGNHQVPGALEAMRTRACAHGRCALVGRRSLGGCSRAAAGGAGAPAGPAAAPLRALHERRPVG